MAKTEAKTETKFEIGEYTEKVKKNPYAEHVDALINAGEDKTLTIRVNEGTGKRQKVVFQKAAGERGKSARVVEEATENGQDVITFRLKPRTPRKTRGTVGNEAAV